MKRSPTPIERYQAFVGLGNGLSIPLDVVRHQLTLGDETFVAQIAERIAPVQLRDVSRAQRRAVAKAAKCYVEKFDDPKQGIAEAYRCGAYALREIGGVFGVQEVTVGRDVRLCSRSNEGAKTSNSDVGLIFYIGEAGSDEHRQGLFNRRFISRLRAK